MTVWILAIVDQGEPIQEYLEVFCTKEEAVAREEELNAVGFNEIRVWPGILEGYVRRTKEVSK